MVSFEPFASGKPVYAAKVENARPKARGEGLVLEFFTQIEVLSSCCL